MSSKYFDFSLRGNPLFHSSGLGTIQILRKHPGWEDGVGKMLTFAYEAGGWVKANAYISINNVHL